MELSIVTNSSEIDNLLRLYQDDVEEYIEGTRGSWLQWLKEMVERENPNVSILVALTVEKVITGYLVVLKCFLPPISESINILYAHSLLSPDENKLLWEQVIDWARQLGAKKIEIRTNKPELMKRHFGFKQDEFVNLYREL